jgi:archaeosine synthase beta-subunit
MLTSVYPAEALTRTRWVEARRPARTVVDPYRPYAFFVEEECGTSGAVDEIATVFITNRECPWRCVMCDLWRNTLTETVPVGAVPAQIDYALKRMPQAKAIKLYNSGSFFDPGAVPVEDYAVIAKRVSGFDRVIVESHPALVGERCLEFRDSLNGRLEVAMGLETAHPVVLEKLNKRMTLEQFRAAARYGVGLGRGRVFVDLWDLKNAKKCDDCYELRLARLQAMNLRQVVLDEIVCSACEGRN